MSKLEIHPKRFELLDANDPDCCFRINIDVLNEAFGVGRSMYAKATFPDKKNTFISGTKPQERFKIWMPKLYGNSSGWKNSISEDCTEIFEIAEDTSMEDWILNHEDYAGNLRIVFVKESPKEPYRFVGVFTDHKMNHLNHCYKRVATRIRLIGNPVHQIELLD